MNFDHINWTNPVGGNQSNFQKMGDNGIQLVRMWLSQWGIYGSAWNPWYSMHHHAEYIPRTGITPFGTDSVKMKISANSTWFDSCMFYGFSKPAPAVKRNTNYKISVKHRTYSVAGPRNSASPNYGLVAKVGAWYDNCQDSGTATLLTPYARNNSDWGVLQGTWNSGSNDFLPYFYLAMENATAGDSYVDEVAIQEDLGGGNLGPNIIYKPSTSHEKYMDQRNSYAFDKVLDLAKQYNVYLRPVILEKNEDIANMIQGNGTYGAKASDNGNFYGNNRTMTAGRWYQQAWWRYLQARWGYSPQIQSWELLNEGSPTNTRHFALADEFGKYIRQFAPNNHLVSTSTWGGFPATSFWKNTNYPNVDFADYHAYVDSASPNFIDTAKATYDPSMLYGAKQSGGAGKPVIRGETGFTDSGTEPGTKALYDDKNGIWLHNFIWGGINHGGLVESYWYENEHIYKTWQDTTRYQTCDPTPIPGTTPPRYRCSFDHRSQYKPFYFFIKDIPLLTGRYVDAQATSSNSQVRVWGQKDTSARQAHLWVANVNHNWRNVVNGSTITPQSASVTIGGFSPNTQFSVDWWNTYSGVISSTTQVTSSGAGVITLQIQNLATDTALKIRSSSAPPATSTPTPRPTNTPSPTPSPVRGDADEDRDVDEDDYSIWYSHYSGSPVSGNPDFNSDGRVDGVDFSIWLNNYGTQL